MAMVLLRLLLLLSLLSAMACASAPETLPPCDESLGVLDPAIVRDLVPPRIISKVAPVLPARGPVLSTEHVVVVGVIGCDGRVHDIAVESATNQPYGAAVVDALSKWRFWPAIAQGKAVPSKYRLEMSF